MKGIGIANKAANEMRLAIDAKTMRRHDKLVTRGDYARIAEMSNVTRSHVADCFKTGRAAATVCKMAKKFYAEKEKAQAELNN